MALTTVTDPNGLSQGVPTTVADLVFTGQSTNNITITSVGNNIPLLLDNEWIEIRNAPDTVNNGLYRVNDATPATDSVDLEKVSGSNPTDAVDTVDTIQIFSHAVTSATDMVFTVDTAPNVTLTSALAGLPSMVAGQRFTVINHDSHNGVYEVVSVTTDQEDYLVKSLTGATGTAASEAADIRTDMKNLFWDTAALEISILEDQTGGEGHFDLDGVLGQAFYSKAVIDWKDDNFLIANAPFPMLTIDSDAGKYLIGQDPSGNNSGWVPVDDAGFSIRTRKMFRNMGWSEIASDGTLNAQYAGIRTLGAFLDETAGTGDLAYYQFGNDTTVDDTVDFTFNGPVNEAILVYDGTATPADTGTGFTITTNDTITRADGGNWKTDGYVVGGKIAIFGATTSANNGTYTVATVADSADGAITVVENINTNDATDTSIHFAVDNRNAVTLRLRERTTSGNSNARTFSQADLAAAGESVLSNRLFTFGLANSQDLNITAADATITGSGPYTGMSITYYAAPQSQGDGGGGGDGLLVGGPYNFGIIIDAATGTNTQVYEFVQHQLRQATDIDADGDTAIGKTMDGLMRFVGATLEVGSTDGGLSFPTNPDGGGSGVYIINLNSASVNDTVFYDNLGSQRSAPLAISVTLDFNTTLEADTLAEYTLFFDYTRRRSPSDLIITAGTGADGTFDSALSGLTALNTGAGQYVRVSGLTGADAAMNGIYQVTTQTGTTQWDVTRYDGETIVTTSSASADIDEYPIDSPDAIIVEDNGSSPVTGTVSGSDYGFSFDYSNNVQGGRSGSTDADVVARAIGQTTAQFAQSSVQTISTSAITIPVTSQIERNFLNP